jgi:hypothetical protein
MPGYRAALLNFTKGEISPEVRARFDLSAYQAAAKRAYNVKIKRTGGLYKRPGTRFVAEALSSASHPIPFQFSDDQAYILEMAQQVMRPLALGGAVLQEGLTITAISQEVNALVTAAFHGYTVNQQVYIADTPMIEINDRFLTVVAVVDDNNFRVNFDSRNATAFTVDGSGGIVRTAPPAAPTPPPATPTPTPAPTPPPVTSGGDGSYVGGTYRGGVGGSHTAID